MPSLQHPMTRQRSRPFWQLRSLGLGLALAELAFFMSACGTGPIPGQPAGQATSSSSTTTGCTAANAQTSITINATDSLKFVPATACLKTGGTVTWKSTSSITHTTTDEPSLAAVAADAALPKGASGWNHILAAGASFSLKLTVAGTYKYFCIPHETLGMVASITVVG
ncbi:MAG: plastocyanin/azurin family copper-binding protein [Candidatus Dormiibacterota bacterium]